MFLSVSSAVICSQLLMLEMLLVLSLFLEFEIHGVLSKPHTQIIDDYAFLFLSFFTWLSNFAVWILKKLKEWMVTG